MRQTDTLPAPASVPPIQSKARSVARIRPDRSAVAIC